MKKKIIKMREEETEKIEDMKQHVIHYAIVAIMLRNMSHYGSHIESGLQHRMVTFEEEILNKFDQDE